MNENLKHECSPENAPKFLDWLANRGGVAVWRSVNLGNPGASWSSPALTWEGKPTPKPTWEADSQPARVITDASEIVVVMRRDVKRVKIAVERGSGLSVTLTAASSRRLRKAVEEATVALQKETGIIGPGASYIFDYDGEQRVAVVTVPGRVVSLAEWAADAGAKEDAHGQTL
jgi:hypothetical protein